MDSILVYLVQRLVYRIVEFFHCWYVRSTKFYWHRVVMRLEQIDHYLAWRITLKHLFEPLYGDYSILGYILGFIFRTLRLFTASIVYAVIFFIAIALYVLWLLIPPFLILQTIAV